MEGSQADSKLRRHSGSYPCAEGFAAFAIKMSSYFETACRNSRGSTVLTSNSIIGKLPINASMPRNIAPDGVATSTARTSCERWKAWN